MSLLDESSLDPVSDDEEVSDVDVVYSSPATVAIAAVAVAVACPAVTKKKRRRKSHANGPKGDGADGDDTVGADTSRVRGGAPKERPHDVGHSDTLTGDDVATYFSNLVAEASAKGPSASCMRGTGTKPYSLKPRFDQHVDEVLRMLNSRG